MSELKSKVNEPYLEIVNLDESVVDYFNNKKPVYITDSEHNLKKINFIFNVGETWEQITNIYKKQASGDLIIQKPIITIRNTGIEPISSWNRLPNMKMLIDKQIYSNSNNFDKDHIPQKNAIPVYEYTFIKHPTFILRKYRLSIWTDYIQDLNKILETILIHLISANSITINKDNYRTMGYLRNITDQSNFDNRTEEYRTLKNYIDLEFEGYLIDKTTIEKKRNFSHFTITEKVTNDSKYF